MTKSLLFGLVLLLVCAVASAQSSLDRSILRAQQLDSGARVAEEDIFRKLQNKMEAAFNRKFNESQIRVMMQDNPQAMELFAKGLDVDIIHLSLLSSTSNNANKGTDRSNRNAPSKTDYEPSHFQIKLNKQANSNIDYEE